MNRSINVDDAITKGHRMVNYPSMGIMFGIIGLSFYLVVKNVLPIWIIPAGFGLSFIFAWLYWSVMITKWRLWAFENVRNVHELKNYPVIVLEQELKFLLM